MKKVTWRKSPVPRVSGCAERSTAFEEEIPVLEYNTWMVFRIQLVHAGFVNRITMWWMKMFFTSFSIECVNVRSNEESKCKGMTLVHSPKIDSFAICLHANMKIIVFLRVLTCAKAQWKLLDSVFETRNICINKWTPCIIAFYIEHWLIISSKKSVIPSPWHSASMVSMKQ